MGKSRRLTVAGLDSSTYSEMREPVRSYSSDEVKQKEALITGAYHKSEGYADDNALYEFTEKESHFGSL